MKPIETHMLLHILHNLIENVETDFSEKLKQGNFQYIDGYRDSLIYMVEVVEGMVK
jgi:hypothetical protein